MPFPALPVICPWFVPPAPPVLRRAVEALAVAESSQSAAVDYAPREVVQREDEPYREVRIIESGLLSQAVINRRLTKPVAMNLYAEGSMMGFLNVFTGVAAPRLVASEKHSRAVVAERSRVLEVVKTDAELLLELAGYCELAAKSELIGMEALFSLALEDRLKLFYAASLLRSGVNPLESREEHLEVPHPITRTALERVIYASRVSLDRHLAEAARSGMLLQKAGKRFVRRRDLEPMTEWILER